MDIIEAIKNADRTLAECAAEEARAWNECIAELRAISDRIDAERACA
jgi:hypothetical protein